MAVGGVLLVFMSRGENSGDGGKGSPGQAASKTTGGDSQANDVAIAPTAGETPSGGEPDEDEPAESAPVLPESACPPDLNLLPSRPRAHRPTRSTDRG